MHKFRNFALAAAGGAIWLSGCAKETPPAPEPEADPSTQITLAQGEIIGVTTPDGAHSWRGIPFAAAPVGDLRWRAPRPAPVWDGVRDGTKFAERCAQMSNRLNESEGIEPGLFLGSEDCLYLDIYAPPGAAGKKLPVMVWIHGGANVWGRGSSYDGSKLAINEDVIIVPVQYRLGPFGFFSHPALRDDAEMPEDAAANFATLDLIASLKWVRENIAAFGGDAENVTVFGESAGGHNVATLLASPLAAGLFDKAIMQSGSFDSVSRADAENIDGAELNPSMKISQKLGAESADDLRATSGADVIEAYRVASPFALEAPTVIQDGVVLPSGKMRDAIDSIDTFNAVPIMTGTNRDEMRFFNFADPALTKKILGVFLAPRDPDYYDALNDYMSLVWRIRSVDGPLSRMTAAGHDAAYAYRFDWDESGRFLFTDFSKLVGAGHAVEIPFVFNRFALFGKRLDKIFFEKKTAESRERLSRAMGAYWASFARDGVPAAPQAPKWPQWSQNGGSVLRLDSINDGGIGVIEGPVTINDMIAEMQADPRIDDNERCKISAAIGEWTPSVSEAMDNAFGCAR